MATLSSIYTEDYYQRHRDGARRSAAAIVPIILDFVRPGSVVDVGCGDGTWLSVFREYGVTDILGIDGEYISTQFLQIPHPRFQSSDLTKPLVLGRVFDLAISLEVAEHLPPGCASNFVRSLTRLAPVVLFSAAIPMQRGDHHVNERWPDEWAALFADHDYVPIDLVRKRVWQDEAVEWWYAQNTLLFVNRSFVELNAALKVEFERTDINQLRLVHPRKYLETVKLAELPVSGLKQASHLFIVCLRNAFVARLRRLAGRDQRRPAHSAEPSN